MAFLETEPITKQTD